MLRAISTKYLGPTNTNGSRVKAIARKREGNLPALALTDSWDHSGSIEDNHARVAKLLAVKMEWSGLYIGGGTDDGYTFVNSGLSSDMLEDDGLRALGVADRDWFIVHATR